MARKAPGLTPLGGDRWRVRIYAGLDPLTGRQIQKSKTFRAPNRTAAMKLAEDHRSAMRKELRASTDRKGTVAELAESFLELKRRDKSPTTVKGYASIAARIVDTFGHLQVASLTGSMVDDWYGRLHKDGMEAATIAHHHAVLRAMLRMARKRGLIDRVVTEQTDPPQVDKFEVRPPTLDVVNLLIQAAPGELGAMLHVLASTGIRRGELCGLAWSDIGPGKMTVRRSVVEVKEPCRARCALCRLTGGKLHVKPPKGRKPRTFGITAQTELTLERQRARLLERAGQLGLVLPDDGPVFADLRADPSGLRPRRPSWVSHAWARHRKLHDVADRLHDLRHANATFMTDAGIPVTTGAKRAGHQQVSTFTDVYGHGTDEADARAVAVLEMALPSPRPPP